MAKVGITLICAFALVILLIGAVGAPPQALASFKVGRWWVSLDGWDERPRFERGHSRGGGECGEFMRVMWVHDSH